MRKIVLAAAGLVAMTAVAFAAGLYTNGMPTVGAGTVNTVAQAAPNGVVTQVTPVVGLIPMDTGLAGGAAPQTVGVTAFQIAAIYGEAAINTATSTVHAATLNTKAGQITTEALTTAAGATYTFTLTNSLLTATSTPEVALYSGTNTGGGITVTSVTAASGSVTVVFTNTGTTALNGTMVLMFHV